jgi:hypothetical protein
MQTVTEVKRIPAEPARPWPDQCPHRELAVTGIPGVFVCLEEGCGEKLVIPELGEIIGLDVASE